MPTIEKVQQDIIAVTALLTDIDAVDALAIRIQDAFDPNTPGGLHEHAETLEPDDRLRHGATSIYQVRKVLGDIRKLQVARLRGLKYLEQNPTPQGD